MNLDSHLLRVDIMAGGTRGMRVTVTVPETDLAAVAELETALAAFYLRRMFQLNSRGRLGGEQLFSWALHLHQYKRLSQNHSLSSLNSSRLMILPVLVLGTSDTN